MAGVVWTHGTTTLGEAATAWAGSSARSGLRLAVLLVVAIGDSASASHVGVVLFALVATIFIVLVLLLCASTGGAEDGLLLKDWKGRAVVLA